MAAEEYAMELFHEAKQIAKKQKRKYVNGADLKDAKVKRIADSRERIANEDSDEKV